MSTEFNYVVNIDTTRLMGAMAEIRSQLGMALGGGPGGQGPIAGFSQMMAGLQQRPPGMGGTFTDPAIAYSPHYGMHQANTSLQQEWQVHRYGLSAARGMKPPGVSAGEYVMGVEKNFIDRHAQASYQSKMAARSAFYSGAGGMAAGELAFMASAPVGAAIGGKLATRFFGAGAAGAGKFLGGMGLGIAAFGIAEDYVGGKIRKHYADIEKIGGVTRELGQIAGGGRGLKRTDQYSLGIAAREAAGDIKMDVQEMGDILALGRQHGMLPSATDPQKARKQFADFAKAIEEGAQVLHTSLNTAMQVIKSTTAQGMTAEQGIMKVVGMGGPAAYARHQAFGAAGGGFALQQRLTRQQGFAMFTGALGQAAGADVSAGGLEVLGGRRGLATLLGAGQMQAATSPMGDLQLMAAAGGQPLGGMFEMPMQALANMAGGEGLLTNMMKFQVHKDEIRRGIGAKGLRTMALQQMTAGGDMLKSFGLGGTSIDREATWVQQSMGMNPTQALAYARGMHQRPGSGVDPAAAKMRQVIAMQEMMVSRASGGLRPPTEAEIKARADAAGGGTGFGLSWAAYGAMGGAMIPGAGLKGAIVGGVGGLIAQNARALWNVFSGDGPPLSASAKTKADYSEQKMNRDYEAQMSQYKARFGLVDIDPAVGQRFLKADLSGMRLNFDAVANPRASALTGGAMSAMGLTPVAAGPGTIYADGEYWSAGEVQSGANNSIVPPKTSAKTNVEATDLVYGAVYSADAEARYRKHYGGLGIQTDISNFKVQFEIAQGQYQAGYFDPKEGGKRMHDIARRIITNIPDTPQNRARKARLTADINKPFGIVNNQLLRTFVEKATGVDVSKLRGGLYAGQAGAAGSAGAIKSSLERERRELSARYFKLPGEGGAGDKIDPYSTEWDPENRPGSAGYKPDTGSSKGSQRDDFVRMLVKSEDYQKAKLLAGQGKTAEAQKLMNKAHRTVMVEGRFSGLSEMKPIDVTKEQYVSETERGGDVVLARVLKRMFDKTNQKSFEQITKEEGGKAIKEGLISKQSFTTEAQRELRTTAKIKPKPKKRRRRQMLSKSIGFGQQESAMTTINRSLRQTHRMLSALHTRISKLPKTGNKSEPTGEPG